MEKMDPSLKIRLLRRRMDVRCKLSQLLPKKGYISINLPSPNPAPVHMEGKLRYTSTFYLNNDHEVIHHMRHK
jgi:hypothetical protein